MNRKPLSSAERYERSQEILLATGGRRVNIRMLPAGIEAMKAIMERDRCTQTEAIHRALMNEAENANP